MDTTPKMMLAETCWAEIDLCNGQKYILVGCMYKHTTATIDGFKICLEESIYPISYKILQ